MSSADQIPVEDAAQKREPRDARRRRELIQATIDSISKHGLSQTTVAKVAEIAGLSAGIVNFYFRTKDALLLATLEHIDLEFERRAWHALVEIVRGKLAIAKPGHDAYDFAPELD